MTGLSTSWHLFPADVSVLQQAAAFGYPNKIYAIKPKETLCVPPWAWLIVAIAALAMLIVGVCSPAKVCVDEPSITMLPGSALLTLFSIHTGGCVHLEVPVQSEAVGYRFFLRGLEEIPEQ